MQSTFRRLANYVTSGPLSASVQEASGQIYPPIPLYRRLLRAHRNLPFDMRSIGDDYIKAEFRRHRQVTNPIHIIGFLTEWKVYLEALPTSRDGGTFKGKRLDPRVFEKMSEEQIGQLYQLMHVTKDLWKPIDPASEGGEHPS